MKWVPTVIASVLLLPLLAAAAPLSPEPPLAALADRDDDGLSDDLQEKLAEALAGDRFKVIVTFSGPGNIALARQAVGEVEFDRGFEGIDGYAATVTAAQAEALARMPGVFSIATITVSYFPSKYGIQEMSNPASCSFPSLSYQPGLTSPSASTALGMPLRLRGTLPACSATTS